MPHEKGKAVLKILVSYKHNTSIFDDFSHYEKRQEEEEGRKPHQVRQTDRRADLSDKNASLLFLLYVITVKGGGEVWKVKRK